LATLRLRIETLEGELTTKDEEIKRLNILKQQQQQNAAPAEERIKVGVLESSEHQQPDSCMHFLNKSYFCLTEPPTR